MPTTNEALRDRLIRHQHFVERFKGGSVKRLIALLAKVEDDIVAQIAKRDPTGVSKRFTDQRLRRLLEEVREINRLAAAGFGAALTAEVRGLAAQEAAFSTNLLKKTIPVALDIVTPNADTVRSVVFGRPFNGRILKDWVKGLGPSRFARIRDALQIGVTSGETVGQLVQRVRGVEGFLATRRGAEAFVRTAVNHTVTAARQSMFEVNADIVKSVQWVATLDSRTCPQCQALDGQIFEIDKGLRPPAHAGCRCTIVPVVKSFRELGIDLDEAPLGTRASLDGQVPETETYGQWLKRQPVDIQDEALGKTRAQLFRKGGITVDRFVDRQGATLNLKQLAKADADLFSAAGVALP